MAQLFPSVFLSAIERERIRYSHVEFYSADIPAIDHALQSFEEEGASGGHADILPDVRIVRYWALADIRRDGVSDVRFWVESRP